MRYKNCDKNYIYALACLILHGHAFVCRVSGFVLSDMPLTVSAQSHVCRDTNRTPQIEFNSFDIERQIVDHVEADIITVYWHDFETRYISEYKDIYHSYYMVLDEMKNGILTAREHFEETICSETNAPCARYTLTRKDLDADCYIRIAESNNCNIEPKSSAWARIKIPPRKTLLPSPHLLTAVLQYESTYNVTWIDVDRDRAANGYYTLFWCSDQSYLLEVCMSIEGSMNITGTGISSLIHKFKPGSRSLRVLKFGIAYNEGPRTSGILWAHCTIWAGADRDFKHTVTIMNATAIKVAWEFECSSRQIMVTQYHFVFLSERLPIVSACEHSGNSSSATKQIAKTFNSAWPDALHRSAVFETSPFSRYNLTMSIDFNGYQYNKSIVIYTPQYAPYDSPTSLVALNNTHDSVQLQWSPPKLENGPDYNYRIVYASHTDGAEEQWTNVVSDPTVCTQHNNLTNLKPYTNYTIFVEACMNSTINELVCSPKSNNISLRTPSFKPPKMDRPYMLEMKSYFRYKRKIKIAWNSLIEFNGEKHSYKLYYKTNDSSTYQQIKTVHHTLNHTEFDVDCRETKQDTLSYKIAAFNGDYTGDLSEPAFVTLCDDSIIYEVVVYCLQTGTFIVFMLILSMLLHAKHNELKRRYRGIRPILPAALILPRLAYKETSFYAIENDQEMNGESGEKHGYIVIAQTTGEEKDNKEPLRDETEKCSAKHSDKTNETPAKIDNWTHQEPSYIPLHLINNRTMVESSSNGISSHSTNEEDELCYDTRSIESISLFVDNLINKQ